MLAGSKVVGKGGEALRPGLGTSHPASQLLHWKPHCPGAVCELAVYPNSELVEKQPLGAPFQTHNVRETPRGSLCRLAFAKF